MAFNTYYVTGTCTCAQVLNNVANAWDASRDAIVFANFQEEAPMLFWNTLTQHREGDIRTEITIRKTAVAPIVNQLLTESGNVPLDWAKILEQSKSLLESTPADDFEQGYWVDVDALVPSDKISFSLGTLESNVPEDVRSGLNWSSDKQFFFLLKVLPLPLPTRPAYEIEAETENENSGLVDDIDGDVDAENEPAEEQEPGPGEIDMVKVVWPETVAVVQARNSVAAAWLWRRYAASTNTQWINNAIRITPLCGTMGEMT